METTTVQASADPCFFGDPESALFGCYHAPKGSVTRDCAVVLCYPMGHEYIRCHRAFRLLAAQLAAAGFPVLRFDYFGTGDSSGQSDQVQLERWVGDTIRATRYLQERSGASRLALIGLRLGATLGLIAAAKRGPYDRMVLWEPVVDGPSYLDQLAAVHAAHLEERGFVRKQDGSVKIPEGVTEVLGFSYSAGLIADLKALGMASIGQRPADHMLFVDNAQDTATACFRTILEGLGGDLHCENVPDAQLWTVEPYKSLLPHASLRVIVSWMSGVPT